MHQLIWNRRWLVCAAAVALVGCGPKVDQRPLVRPIAAVDHVEVMDASEEGVRLDFVVHVTNPNLDALPLKIARYEATIGSLGTYKGDMAPDATAPATGVQIIRLPVAIATTTSSSVNNMSWSLTGSIEYQPPGQIRELLTDMSIPLPSTPVQGGGQIGVAAAESP